MIYELYTFPHCERCEKVKEILKEKGIDYEEINLGTRVGKRTLGKIYFEICNKLKKDKNNMSVLPILVRKDNSKIEVAQEVEGIEKLLENYKCK